jgi:mono/diheme cytochrome c family protein
LRKLKPEIVFDPSRLKTQEDWIKAGERVFHWPVASYRAIENTVSHLDTNHFRNSKARITRDGVYLFNQYFLNDKGKLMIGSLSCASCHTRVLESGEIVKGGQGNLFDNVGFANAVQSGRIPFQAIQHGTQQLHYAPWSPGSMKSMPTDVEEFVGYINEQRSGAIDRQGNGYLYPVVVPSLIGVKDIKYLDRTGLMQHETPGDMMRYAAFNQGMDIFTSYNGFIPGAKNKNSELPLPAEWSHAFGYVGKRYTDAQLYALTQYIYSLQPPENPNQYAKGLIAKGSMIFKREGCVSCHTPPLYTNNKLTPANGFEPPEDHFKKYDIFNVSVETDSVTALYTRRGTGYYKVPSLRGVWFQDGFFHNGNLASLEDVFDPKRLQSDYVPSGYKPPGIKNMAVKGHPFGLDLSAKDKTALIAFLKTL